MRITKENLTRYDQHFKSWHRRRLGYGKALENWHQTEEAGAVAFYPVGGSPLDGKVKFSFKETPPANGDKGPENPSTITGVNKINLYRANKNILAVADFRATATIRNVTWTNNGDGSISVTRNSVGDGTSFYDIKGLYNALEYFPAGTYTFTSGGEASNVRFGLSTADTAVVTILGSDVTKTFTLEEGMYLHFYAYLYQNNAASNVVIRPQLEFSPEASSYEIGISDTYQVSFGSTYYGGEIDLATGLMTVTMQYMVADSNAEILWIGTNFVAWRYPAGLDCIGRAVGTEVCSHFPFNGAWDGSFAHFYATPSLGLYIANPNWTTSTYRQYFTDQYNNGTPVTACYQLANPFTVQLPPLALAALAQTSRHEPRLNTVYTDADSIQITYQKSPIRAATEQEMAILGLGGNV